MVENTDLNAYGYDAVGNRINETNKVQTKTITISNTVNGVSRQEQITTSPEAATTATFNDLNELTQLNEPNGISNFTYDLNGNLSQISKNSTVISKYEYDVRNQLTKAKDGLDNELARFDYDFERKRISKSSSNLTTNYTYAGNQVVNEFQNNATSASYTIGAGEIVKSEFSSGENSFHYTDALGSVTALANTQGSLTSRNEYNAFGELSTSGGSSNSIGYTGQRLDSETGLMALGNGERYYSPSYARFIQQDSWLGDSQMPQSLNRFSYGYNNPNKYTDPSGNEPVTISIAGFLLISFLVGVAINVYQQDQQIQKGERRQEDFSMSEAAVANTIIGTSYRAATGTDAVTGQKLTNFERAIAVGETALEFASVAGKVVGATTKSAKLASAANLIGNAAEGTQAAIGVYRGGDATIDLVKRGEYSQATLTGILTALSAYGGSQSYKGIKAELPKWKMMPPGVGIDGVGLPSVKFVGGKGAEELTDFGEQIATVRSNTTKIDTRLQNRLDVWKRYKANGGEMDMKRWVQATQRFYGNPNRFGEGYGKWVRGHGNSKQSNLPAELYVKFDGEGNFMKWGISQNSATRYSQSELTDANGLLGEIRPLRVGKREDILKLERRLTERFPGPENLEPWAGVRNPNHPNYKGKQK